MIQKYAWQAVTSVLTHSHYVSIVRGKIAKEWDDPYLFCFMGILGTFALYEKHFGGKEVIDFCLDRQVGLEEKATRLYGNYMKLPIFAGLMGENVDFRNDKTFVPLQAADLIAWQARRHWARNEVRPHFIAAKTLKRPPFRAVLDRKHIQRLKDAIENRPVNVLSHPMISGDGPSLDGTTLEKLQEGLSVTRFLRGN